jgi:hypothetical protein
MVRRDSKRQHSVGKGSQPARDGGRVAKRQGTTLRKSSRLPGQSIGSGQGKGKGRSKPPGRKGQR